MFYVAETKLLPQTMSLLQMTLQLPLFHFGVKSNLSEMVPFTKKKKKKKFQMNFPYYVDLI